MWLVLGLTIPIACLTGAVRYFVWRRTKTHLAVLLGAPIHLPSTIVIFVGTVGNLNGAKLMGANVIELLVSVVVFVPVEILVFVVLSFWNNDDWRRRARKWATEKLQKLLKKVRDALAPRPSRPRPLPA